MPFGIDNITIGNGIFGSTTTTGAETKTFGYMGKCIGMMVCPPGKLVVSANTFVTLPLQNQPNLDLTEEDIITEVVQPIDTFFGYYGRPDGAGYHNRITYNYTPTEATNQAALSDRPPAIKAWANYLTNVLGFSLTSNTKTFSDLIYDSNGNITGFGDGSGLNIDIYDKTGSKTWLNTFINAAKMIEPGQNYILINDPNWDFLLDGYNLGKQTDIYRLPMYYSQCFIDSTAGTVRTILNSPETFFLENRVMTFDLYREI